MFKINVQGVENQDFSTSFTNSFNSKEYVVRFDIKFLKFITAIQGFFQE